jgi:DNA-directed RNA polymerase subunit N (RpoN/RPB10)
VNLLSVFLFFFDYQKRIGGQTIDSQYNGYQKRIGGQTIDSQYNGYQKRIEGQTIDSQYNGYQKRIEGQTISNLVLVSLYSTTKGVTSRPGSASSSVHPCFCEVLLLNL